MLLFSFLCGLYIANFGQWTHGVPFCALLPVVLQQPTLHPGPCVLRLLKEQVAYQFVNDNVDAVARQVLRRGLSEHRAFAVSRRLRPGKPALLLLRRILDGRNG